MKYENILKILERAVSKLSNLLEYNLYSALIKKLFYYYTPF